MTETYEQKTDPDLQGPLKRLHESLEEQITQLDKKQEGNYKKQQQRIDKWYQSLNNGLEIILVCAALGATTSVKTCNRVGNLQETQYEIKTEIKKNNKIIEEQNKLLREGTPNETNAGMTTYQWNPSE